MAAVEEECLKVCTNDVERSYELDRCTEWILRSGLCKICLQFPDALLADSAEVALCLANRVGTQPYILGDTSYGSCCVDEVAAQHVNADGIIHFGHACLSPTRRLPVLYIFEKLPIDVTHCVSCFRNAFKDKTSKVLLLYDVGYHHAIDAIVSDLFSNYPNLIVSDLATSCDVQRNSKLGRKIELPSSSTIEDYSIVFIGKDGPTLSNVKMTFQGESFYWYNPTGTEHFVCCTDDNKKFLMKRMHLIQRVVEAKTLGIVVGTLSVLNYVEAIDRIKELAKQCEKKTYIFSIGKLNVAKLANFPEIDIFVMIACPENSLLNSKEFYRPIVTPYEVEMACNSNREWSKDYVLEFQHFLPGGSDYQELSQKFQDAVELSTVAGERHSTCGNDIARSDTVAQRAPSAITSALGTGTNFLQQRSWQGLQLNLDKDDPVLVTKGRSGIPNKYNTDLDAMKQAEN